MWVGAEQHKMRASGQQPNEEPFLEVLKDTLMDVIQQVKKPLAKSIFFNTLEIRVIYPKKNLKNTLTQVTYYLSQIIVPIITYKEEGGVLDFLL